MNDRSTSPSLAQLLRETVPLLLDEHADPSALQQALATLHGAFTEAVLPGEAAGPGLELEHGVALAPADAGSCLVDPVRTPAFARGVCAAIDAAVARFPGERVEVLYAGCGPFGMLILPACTRFSAEQVGFTLLEVQEKSLAAARSLIEQLELSDHVREFVQADGATYHPERRPHVLVIESLQQALTKEPQVALTRNLAGSLQPGGVLVPKSITVDLCLNDTALLFARPPVREPRHLAQLADLGLEHPGEPARTVVRIPPVEEDGARELTLHTNVRVSGSIRLEDYDTGLTCPLVLWEFERVREGQSYEFEYVLGEEPGFRCRMV